MNEQILNRKVTNPDGTTSYVSGATPQDVSSAITARTLTPQTPIQVAPPPTPTLPNTGGTSATMTANQSSLTTPPPGWDATTYANFKAANPTLEPTPQDTAKMNEPAVPDWVTQALKGNDQSSTAIGDLYQSTYGVSPDQAKTDKATAQADLNTKNAAVQSAQERYNALNAQIQGLDYQQNTVIPNQDQVNATGRGITAAGLAPITAAQQRQVLLQKAPLQYSALLAQADLANAQGKATLAKGILDQAQGHLDGLFNAQKEDITNSVNHQNSNFDKIFSYLTTKEQNQVAETKAQTATNQTQANNYINDIQTAIKDATASGDTVLAGSIAKLATVSLNPTSKTFSTDYAKANSDLAALQGQIQGKMNSQVIGSAETGYTNVVTDASGKVISTTKVLNGTGGGSNISPQDLIAYAQQYASNGQVPTGLPKGSFGVVAQYAKELPKANGEIVDNNTNVKSSKLTPTQADAYAALKDIVNKTDEAKALFTKLNTGLVGGLLGNTIQTQDRQAYNVLRGEIIDLLTRARSGAAITAKEEQVYGDKIPGTFNQTLFIGASGANMLDGLKSSISNKLDTGLRANGVSMVGFSKVDLGGKPYTVGDVITVNGVSGRVMPDGSISVINQ